MDLTLQMIPFGGTTSREISEASQDLREALERLQGVAQVGVARALPPEDAKGVGEVGKFMVSVAPAALSAMMQALKTVLAPHPPTKMIIQTKSGEFRFEFDPKTVSLKDLVEAVDRLRVAAP